MMIEEAYVCFETAKLLKDKGFDSNDVGGFGGFYSERCYESGYGVITQSGQEVGIVYDDLTNSELDHDEYLRPTQQMAMRWLREVHNIEICVNIGLVGKDHKKMYDWCPVIVKENLLEYPITYPDGSCSVLADSYEEAVEEALKYCLTKLI